LPRGLEQRVRESPKKKNVQRVSYGRNCSTVLCGVDWSLRPT